MKKYMISLLSFCFIFTWSQKREMAENFSRHNFDKTIEIGKEILKSEPDDFETILMVARAEDEKGNFEEAIPYLEKAKMMMTEDWQKSWTLLEMAKNNFGGGNFDLAKQNYDDAQKIVGTKNSMKSLKNFGMLAGLDAFYKNWNIRESKNLIFHFENGIDANEIDRILTTRQKAFDEINAFFDANLPKKIDFFVWNLTERFNPYLNANLGFTNSVYCISHNRLNQTPGHEIAHNISFWKNRNQVRSQLIDEGIGVAFDQQKDDKFKIAKEIYEKNPIDIREIWKNNSKTDEDILYPIAGAFVNYLIKYNKEKFLKLIENQSYENAEKIYCGKIDKIIQDFILKLTK